MHFSRIRIWLGTVAVAVLLVVGSAGAARADVIFQGDIPIAQVIVNPCIGEPLFVTGVFHIVIRAEEDTSGGMHYGYHLNTAQQFQGETASGVKYVETSSGAIISGNLMAQRARQQRRPSRTPALSSARGRPRRCPTTSTSTSLST